MIDKILLAAACRIKHINPEDVAEAEISRDGFDIILTLADGGKMRVELLALPAEILRPISDTPQTPAPEHATLTEPTPVKLEAPRKKGRK